jgi:hypothetical protein
MSDYAAAPEPEAPKRQKNGLTPSEERKVLEEARRRMKYALEADSDDRSRAQGELAFVWNKDNCQWDDEAKKARKKRPMLTENRNPSFIRQATNEVRRSRPQIRVLPVDGKGDVQTAQIFEGLIRNIEANSRADMAYDQAVDLAGFCGRGYWKVTTEYKGDGFEQDIVIQPVPDPFSVVDDPDTAMPDKSDRKFAFEVEKVPREEYEARYGKEPATFEDASKALGDYTADWCDEKFIFVANYWRVIEEKSVIYRMSDGKVVPDADLYVEDFIAQQKAMVAMNPAAIMMTPPELPTVKDQRDVVKRRVEWYCVDGLHAHSKGTWSGQFIPLVYTTCEQMKVAGKWATKGMTYDAKDLTKANNYLLSAQIENIALTPKVPFIGPKGAFEADRAKWNTVNQEAHAFIEFDTMDDAGNPINVAPMRPEGVKANPEISSVRMGVIDGQRSVVGLMGASLGDGGPEVAFKAIEARQAKGDTAIFHVMDNLVRAVRYCGMVIVDLIPRVYDSARVVRILNPDGTPEMVEINKLFVDEKTGEPRQLSFAEGKYDVTVSAGPAFETQRQRDNALLVQLVEKVPQMAAAVPDLLAKSLLSGADGDKIAQRLARTIDPAILGEGVPPQVKQMQQKMQEQEQVLKQTTQAKDFAESELMKQRSLVQKAEIDKDRATVDLQKKVAELEASVAKADLDKQKAELALQKAQLEAIRASLPAQFPAGMPAPMQ